MCFTDASDGSARDAELTREEVIALVLYTGGNRPGELFAMPYLVLTLVLTLVLARPGPMYTCYNREMRDALSLIATSNSAHHAEAPIFLTTIHMIVSGLIKLSKLTKLGDGVTLFRGLSGRNLPKEFLKADEYGCWYAPCMIAPSRCSASCYLMALGGGAVAGWSWHSCRRRATSRWRQRFD